MPRYADPTGKGFYMCYKEDLEEGSETGRRNDSENPETANERLDRFSRLESIDARGSYVSPPKSTAEPGTEEVS